MPDDKRQSGSSGRMLLAKAERIWEAVKFLLIVVSDMVAQDFPRETIKWRTYNA